MSLLLLFGGGAAPQTVTAQVATITLNARNGTVTTGAISTTRQVATLTLDTRRGTLTPGTATITCQVATLTLTATAGDWIARIWSSHVVLARDQSPTRAREPLPVYARDLPPVRAREPRQAVASEYAAVGGR